MTNTTETPAPIAATFAQAADGAADYLLEKFGAERLQAAGVEGVVAAMLHLLNGGVAAGAIEIID